MLDVSPSQRVICGYTLPGTFEKRAVNTAQGKQLWDLGTKLLGKQHTASKARSAWPASMGGGAPKPSPGAATSPAPTGATAAGASVAKPWADRTLADLWQGAGQAARSPIGIAAGGGLGALGLYQGGQMINGIRNWNESPSERLIQQITGGGIDSTEDLAALSNARSILGQFTGQTDARPGQSLFQPVNYSY